LALCTSLAVRYCTAPPRPAHTVRTPWLLLPRNQGREGICNTRASRGFIASSAKTTKVVPSGLCKGSVAPVGSFFALDREAFGKEG